LLSLLVLLLVLLVEVRGGVRHHTGHGFARRQHRGLSHLGARGGNGGAFFRWTLEHEHAQPQVERGQFRAGEARRAVKVR
jgi:hypothetical protein